MQRNSRDDSEGTVWQTVGIPLGERGLDLRRPDDPLTLTELRNARFQDARTIVRRGGHTGRLLQDRSFFTLDKTVTNEWIYGHGTRIAINGNDEWDNEHHPVHIRGGGTFSLGNTDVAWTGDRLLVAQADGAFYGTHGQWDRTPDGTGEPYGHPAFLPVQTDSHPPLIVTSDQLDTGLFETTRLVVFSNEDERLEAHLIDRETGSIISSNLIDDDNGPPLNVRVVNSGGIPFVLYMNSAGLQVTHYNGGIWDTPDVIDPAVDTYDVAVVDNGFHVAWRVDSEIFMGRFIYDHTTDSPYEFGSVVDTDTATPNGALAVSVNTHEYVALAWQATIFVDAEIDSWTPGLYTQYYLPDLTPFSGVPLALNTIANAGFPHNPTPSAGLTCSFRLLRDSEARPSYLVHFAYEDSDDLPTTAIYEAGPFGALNATSLVAGTTLHNTSITSRSFRVGDEVFVWLQAANSGTSFLAAGVTTPQISGVSDREEAVTGPNDGVTTWLQNVSADPLTPESRFSWIRSYDAGSYFRAGNTRLGDIDFLPSLSAVNFGRSVYVAGSHPRNWDGTELGDAGFNDYPITTLVASNSSGNLPSSKAFNVRAYYVRYNKMGERFVSPAVTVGTSTGVSDDTITATTRTTALTNHDDVKIEFYRTEGDGTTFYLETTIDNDRSQANVSVTLGLSDAALRIRPADPHAAGLGALSELEEFGPIGCETFVVAGDRIWGVGGQVPAGIAQFSKLYENGEGAGFDALAGTQTLDATGGNITSIQSFGDSAVVAFQRERIYVIMGNGPDNFGSGSFGVPQLVLADGALNHAGTGVTPLGVVFWGAGGPRILGTNFRVENISEPVGPLADTLTPTGVRVDLAKCEVVWYTAEGDALLWCYSSQNSRWARWDGLPIAGVSSRCLVTTDGHLLVPADTDLDDGRRFTFDFATGNVRLESLLNGGILLRRLGIAGEYLGPHRVKFKIYYNGSPHWTEKVRWSPADRTWLTAASEWEDLTAAEIDALDITEQAGTYSTHRRVERQTCRYFRVLVSDGGDVGFTPWELTFEVGATPGLGRTAINTFQKG